jgi:tetratricopeptide (TPR) repeat protein
MKGPAEHLAAAAACAAGGDHARALALCADVLRRAPGHADALGLASLCCLNLGDLPGAIGHATRLTRVAPGDARAHKNLARLLIAERRTDEALAALDKAAALDPADAEPAVLAGAALAEAGRYASALRRVEPVLAGGTPPRGALQLAANCLLNTGRAAEAAGLLERALGADPEDDEAASALCLALHYVPGVPPARVFEAHRAYGRLLDRRCPPAARPAGAGRGGRIRVGLLSPDLRTHSVAFFVLPWLRHRDRGAFEVFAYYTNRHADAMTAEVRALCDHWREMGNIADDFLAREIAGDDLDVLVELSGHSAGHSLRVMQHRPARAAATYIGYPGTTGLGTVDFRIVDSITDPPGASEASCTEALVRLDPCFLCFEPPRDAPEPGPPPRERSGRMTFGSFNAAAKINPPLLTLWARVLAAVPGSRLVLKAAHFAEAPSREGIARMFAAAGGDASRLEVLPPCGSQAEHLAAYGRVDVALDTFPYHGTTTTLEALWMGVPVVTRAGGTHVSRVGVSLLAAAGLSRLVARDEESYVRLAADLAADGAGLARLRATLRGSVAGSALCDGPGFSRRLEAALRAMAGGQQ